MERSKELFKLITENLKEVIWVSTPGVEEMLYISPSYERVWGKSCQSLYKNPHSFADAIHPEDRDRVIKMLSLHKKGQWDTSYRIIDQKARIRWIRDIGSPIYKNGKLKCLIGSATDVTELVESQKNFELSEKKFYNAFHYAAIGMALLDIKGCWLKANRALCRITGYSEKELLKKNFQQITYPADLAKDLSLMKQLLHGEIESYEMEKRYIHKNGRIIWILLTGSLVRDEYGKPLYFIAQIQDISKAKKHEALIEKQAKYDGLTNLPNRSFLDLFLQEKKQHALSKALNMSLLMIDLDEFKDINDALGHNIGDIILKKIANRLAKFSNKSIFVTRFGGDEFVVVALLKSKSSVIDLANKIQKSIGKTLLIKRNQSLQLRASIGVARYPDDTKIMEELLPQADAAMYTAKRLGKNKIIFFTPDMKKAAIKQNQLKQELVEAFKNKQFSVHFQPIYDPAKKVFSSAEALLRWHHPQKGIIFPSAFIEFIEPMDIINDICELVIKNIIKFIKKHKAVLSPGFRFSFNVSSYQFNTNYLKKILENHKKYLPYLTIEITESVFLKTSSIVLSTFKLIHQNQGQISIDDFGTGYSSLAYIQKFKVNALKIDKSFIQKINYSSKEHKLIAAIIAIAKAYKLQVIAEGIENKKQANYLKKFPGVMQQGFYYSKPLAFNEFFEFLTQHKIKVKE